MEAKTLESAGPNTGQLIYNEKTSISLKINRGSFMDKSRTSHPLFDDHNKYFKRNYYLKYKNKKVYVFKKFGELDGITNYFVGFSFWEHQMFLWLQKSHWFQKEENIRYLVNIFFLLIGLYFSFLKK